MHRAEAWVLGPILLILATGCDGGTTAAEADGGAADRRQAREVGPADKVGAADFDGDGADEVVRFHQGAAHWQVHTVELGGEVQVVLRVPAAGGRGERLLVGTGMGRTSRDADTRIWALGAGGPELLFQRKVERNQVADLDVVDGRIWMALFDSGKAVEAGWLSDGAFDVRETRDLATAWLPLDGERRVVGRVYGDTPKAPGDLRLVTTQGDTVLPSLRGVRALTATDLDGDGHPELLVGDGWHYSYGKQGVARVQVLEGPDWTRGRTIAMFDGEYTAWAIEPVGDRLLVTGTKAVHWLTRDALGWSDEPVASVTETGNAVAFHDDSGWWALVSGTPARVVPLN